MTEQAAGERVAQAARVAAMVPGAAQMRALGVRLAGLLRPGDLVVLAGPLGAGKTTLVQGIGDGLGVRGPITSPTFVIARVHPSLRGGPDLVHADAYRLGSRLEVDDLDLDADTDHAVTVVEWGAGLVENLVPGHLLISIGWAAHDGGAGRASDESAGASGGAAGASGGAAGPSDESARSAGEGPGDEPRIVTVAGYGERWRSVAGELSAVLSGAA